MNSVQIHQTGVSKPVESFQVEIANQVLFTAIRDISLRPPRPYATGYGYGPKHGTTDVISVSGHSVSFPARSDKQGDVLRPAQITSQSGQ